MPAIAAHYYYGQEIYTKLPKLSRTLVDRNKLAFDLGLQGPDILFYHTPLKRNKVNIYGQDIHNNTARVFFENPINYIRESSDEVAFSYLIGFVCHFALDSYCHKDINKLAPTFKEHIKLETELDRLILLKIGKVKPEKVKRYEYISSNEDIILGMTNIFSELKFEELKTSVESMRFYSRLIHSPYGVKKLLLESLEKAKGKSGSFSYLSMTNRKYEEYVPLAEKIMLMWDEAIIFGVKIVNNLYNSIVNGEELIKNFDKNFE
ncbi:MAG: zinc dependent phospholipase C family protein [Filifactoraceae bacterium]